MEPVFAGSRCASSCAGMLRLVPHRPLVTCGSCLLVTLSPANFLVSSGRRELDCAVTAIVECWRFGSCVNAWFGIQSSWYRGTFRFFIGLALQRLANREVPGNLDKRRVLVRLPEAACCTTVLSDWTPKNMRSNLLKKPGSN